MIKGRLFSGIVLMISALGFSCFGVNLAYAVDSSAVVEKRLWKDSSQTNTFSPGDEVYVSLAISAPNGLSQGVNIVDKLPAEAMMFTVSQVTTSAEATKCGVAGPNSLTSASFSVDDTAKEVVIGDGNRIEITTEPKYFCYKFSLDANKEAKNVVREVGTVIWDDLRDNIIFGGENNYMLIVGAPWGDSTSTTPETAEKNPAGEYPVVGSEIKDELIKNSARIARIADASSVDLAKYSTFMYLTSAGKSSRGGYLMHAPVIITDSSGEVVLGAANSYIFYNPLYYIFGNIFSGGSSATRAFDFSSRNSAISVADSEAAKLNSEAVLYDYNFDKNSLIYWDQANRDKNKQMEENIGKYIDPPQSEVVCTLATNVLTNPAQFNLYASDCNSRNGSPTPDQEALHPSGRVWYYKLKDTESADFELKANFRGKGTIIVDFENKPNGRISINKNIDATLGLILINGGNVVFDSNAGEFNGIVFVPGDQDPSTTDGVIEFKEGGSPLVIKGSLVANKIKVNPRAKSTNGYAVEIYSDAGVLSSGLLGFETISSVIY